MALGVSLLLAAWHAAVASAGGFAALVSPPRFELTSRAGTTVRQVFELTNRSTAPAKFRVHTADFTLGADYSVAFQDELQADSCRPWVAIERPEVALPGGGTIRYRFEVQVPKDAPAGEGRVGILGEGEGPAGAQSGARRLPASGRNGIIAHVIVGAPHPPS